MKEPTISLVIPAYNEEKYIGKCLEHTIKNSQGKFYEIIVVDNASTDRTFSIASSYPQVKVIKEERKGQVRARQRGYVESKGDILAWIDADTEMPSGWVDKIIEEFKKDKDLGCLSGPYYYYDISRWNRFLFSVWTMFTVVAYNIVGYLITGGNFAIKKEVLEKMGGFDTDIEFYGEDTNIARRAHEFGKVKFMLNFSMSTSGRRFKNEGIFKTGYTYFINFLSEILYHRPATKEYKDYR